MGFLGEGACGSERWLGCRLGSKAKPHRWHPGGSVWAPGKAGGWEGGLQNRVVSLITRAECGGERGV